jgi:hypothetical protein
MNFHRVRLGIAVASVGLAVFLSAAAPVSAAQFKAKAKHHKTTTTTTHKGSNPSGSFCTLYKDELNASSKSSAALEKAVEGDNWPAAKKLLIASFSQEGKVEKEFITALGSVPANVKAAGQEALKAVPAEEKAIQSSNSITQYETALEAALSTPKMAAAGKVFQAYETSTCGSTIPVS